MEQLDYLTKTVSSMQKTKRGADSRSPTRFIKRDSTSPRRGQFNPYNSGEYKYQPNRRYPINTDNNLPRSFNKTYTYRQDTNNLNNRGRTRFQDEEQVATRYHSQKSMTKRQQTELNTTANTNLTDDDSEEEMHTIGCYHSNRPFTPTREKRQRGT